MKSFVKLFALSLLVSAQAQAQTFTPANISLAPPEPVCLQSTSTKQACITIGNSAVDKVDIFFLFDDTGSFAGFVPTVTGIFSGLVSDLEAALPGVEFGFGVGRFEDYGGPGNSYSSENSDGRPFTLNQPVVTAATAGGAAARDTLINDALQREAPGYGGDGPESAIAEGLYQVATGLGFDGDGDGATNGVGGTQIAGSLGAQSTPDASGDVPAFSSLDPGVPHSGSVGGAGFRNNALKIVVLATDICSIAAFDPSQPIPTSISGVAGGSAPIESFACSSTDPGSARFGYVGDAKSSAANTVVGAVAPSGSATVPQTFAALNAAGIRVIGMIPGGEQEGIDSATLAATVLPSGPSFDPNVWLSAAAYLTGGIDSGGTPLVFPIGSGGDPLQNAIVNAVAAAVARPIDISLSPSGSVPNVNVSVTPALVPDVAPGGQACFNVAFAGAGFPSGALNLVFKDVESTLALGSIPATVSCPVPDPQCSDVNIQNDQFILDGNTLALRDQAIAAAKTLRSLGGSKKAVKSIVTQANALYNEGWTLIWSVDSTVTSCASPQVFCSQSSNSDVVASFLTDSSALKALVDSTAAKIRRAGDSRRAKKFSKIAAKLLTDNQAAAARIPSVNYSCVIPAI